MPPKVRRYYPRGLAATSAAPVFFFGIAERLSNGVTPEFAVLCDCKKRSRKNLPTASLKEFVRSFIAELLVIAIGAPIVFWVMVSTDGCR